MVVESSTVGKAWLLAVSPSDDACDDESWDVVDVRRVVGVLLGEAEVAVARGERVSSSSILFEEGIPLGRAWGQLFTYQMKSNQMQ